MRFFSLYLFAISTGVKSQFSPSPPPTVATSLTMPSASANTGGNAVAGSCAARVGQPCEFELEACCNTMNFGVSIPPNFVQTMDCNLAKNMFNSAQSQSFSDSDCASMKIDIELSGGTNCACKSAPTAPPKIEGPCTQRMNGTAFMPCSFLPVEKTGCCPMEHFGGIPDPGSLSTVFLSCGVINASLFGTGSTNWTDDQCLRAKAAIEAIAFELDGCVCPSSDKLNTLPPSQAPVTPSEPPTPAPTLQPTISASSLVSSALAIIMPVVFGLVFQAI